MGTLRQILVGLVCMAFLLGGVTMVTPFGSEAEAGGYSKKKYKKYYNYYKKHNHKKSSQKDSARDHDDLDGKLNMLKDATEVLEQNQTMMKADIATILEKVMNGGDGGEGNGIRFRSDETFPFFLSQVTA